MVASGSQLRWSLPGVARIRQESSHIWTPVIVLTATRPRPNNAPAGAAGPFMLLLA